MNSSPGPRDLDDRLRAAFDARAGDGRLPADFAARLTKDLPPRLAQRQGPARWLSWSAPDRRVGRAAGLAATLVAGLAILVVAVLVVTAARPDLLAGLVSSGSTSPSLASHASPSLQSSSLSRLGPSSTPSLMPSPSPTPAPLGVSSARYDDGIPREIDGRPVFRGAAADTQAKAVTDDTPFLIAGWVRAFPPGTVMFCTVDSNTTWLNDCPPTTLLEVAGEADSTLSVSLSFHFVRDQARTGPAVLEVHVHDPRAADCGFQVQACAAAMIVDRILWTGDAATDPQPLTIDAVRSILATLQPTATLEAGVDSGGGCNQPPSSWFYSVQNPPDTAPAIVSVAIEPSIASRQRAVPQAAGAAAALAPGWSPKGPICAESGSGAAGRTTWVAYRDLAVANVVVSVQTSLTPTAADRSLVERLAAALEQAVTTAP